MFDLRKAAIMKMTIYCYRRNFTLKENAHKKYIHPVH